MSPSRAEGGPLLSGALALRSRVLDAWRSISGRSSPALTVVVSPHEVSISSVDGKSVAITASVQSASEADPQGCLLEALGKALAASNCRPGRVKLVLSDHWLRPVLIPLPSGRLNDSETELLAAHRYKQIYGEQGTSWSLRWIANDDGSLVIAAWPDALLDGLCKAIDAWSGELISAVPRSLDSIRAAGIGRTEAWIIVSDAMHATVVRFKQGALCYWRCHPLDGASADGDSERVCGQLQQAAARAGDGCLDFVILGPVKPGDWSETLRRRLGADGWAGMAVDQVLGAPVRVPRLDFSRPQGYETRSRHRAYAAVALIIGVELGVLAWTTQTTATERVQLEDERGRLTRRLRSTAEPLLPKELTVNVQAANAMVGKLSVPWEELLSTLESVRGERIVIDSLRPDLAGRKVEIAATAAAFEDIAEFVNRINATEALHQAVLVSEASGREPGIRFAVTASWAEAK